MANFPSSFVCFVIVMVCTSSSVSSQITTQAPDAEATTVGVTVADSLDESVTTTAASDNIADPCSEFTDKPMCCKDTLGGLYNCSYCVDINADPVSKKCSSTCEGDGKDDFCAVTDSSTPVSPDTAADNSSTTVAPDTPGVSTEVNDTTTTAAANETTTAGPTTATTTADPTTANATTTVITTPTTTGPTEEPVTGCDAFSEHEECCSNNCSYCVNTTTNADQGCYLLGECLTLNNTDVCEHPDEPTAAPNGTDTTPSAKSGGDSDGQRFDGASFIGGVILCGGLVALIFFGLKFYKSKKETNYHTL